MSQRKGLVAAEIPDSLGVADQLTQLFNREHRLANMNHSVAIGAQNS